MKFLRSPGETGFFPLLYSAWPEDDTVNVEDHSRRQLIREAEYQADCDATSQVLRVSGKVRPPDTPPLKAIVVKGKP